MPAATTTPPQGGRPALRRRALAGLAVAALLLHAALLGGAGSGIDRSFAPATGAAPLVVRVIAGEAPPVDGSPAAGAFEAVAPAAEATPVPTTPSVPPQTPEAAAPPSGARPPAAVAAASAMSPPAAPAEPVTAGVPPVQDAASGAGGSVAVAAVPTLPTAASRPTAAPPADAASASATLEVAAVPAVPAGLVEALPADEALPTYRTKFPPATTLRYEVRRGLLRGSGEIRWRPGADDYVLRLEARVAGFTLLAQASDGGIDGAGLAPLRFTDQRARRPAVAANFQRAAGKVTFSGSSAELPLRHGMQDRLSWMIQLAGVLDAEPELLMPGGKVVMVVVGARGEAAVWVFRFAGFETVDVADGSLHAAKLSRDARGAYDTAVEVWVDPARHHLPVHARQRSGSDEFDLLLESMVPE